MQKEKKILLIDDIRTIEGCRIARNYFTGLHLLRNQKWDELLLDHDLGPESTVRGVEFTGYNVMCWLEEHLEHLPKKITCISANPVGRKRIEQVIKKLYETP